jgi:hypothetical protein
MSRRPKKKSERKSERSNEAMWNAVVKQSTSMGGFLVDPRKGPPDAKKVVELMHAVRRTAIAREKERRRRGFGRFDEEHRAKIRAIWDEWAERDADKATELLSKEFARYFAERQAAGDKTNYADFMREMSILNRAKAGKDPLS